jgi:hypothetical protein
MQNTPLSAYLSPAGGAFIEELPGQASLLAADRAYKISTLCAPESPAPYRSAIVLTGRQLTKLCAVWCNEQAKTL